VVRKAEAAVTDRETIQKLFIRICKDSGYQLDFVQAAYLTGKILAISALEVWIAFADVKLMERISNGEWRFYDN
jgi:hypothetical protein